MIKLYRSRACCYFLPLIQFAPNRQCFPLSFALVAEHPEYKVIGGKHTIVYLCEEAFRCLKKQNKMADVMKVNRGLHIWVKESSHEEARCLQPSQRQRFAAASSVGTVTCLVLNDLYSDQPLHCTMHVSGLSFWTRCGIC